MSRRRYTAATVVDEVGQYEGVDGIASVAAHGYHGELSEACMADLLEEHGTAGEALYAIQLEAQRRVSAAREDWRR